MAIKPQQKQRLSDHQILIVDHDSFSQKHAASILMESGFQVLFADRFAQAKQILEDHTIDLIISELSMPGEPSIEFLKFVRRIYDRKHDRVTPFIVVTDSPQSLEQKGLDNYPMQGCLFKEVDQEDLLERVYTNLNLHDEEGSASLGEQNLVDVKVNPGKHCRIILSDFINQETLKFNIYIRLSKEKFVRVAKTGEKANEKQFRRYLDKGVKHLYVKKADYKKVVDYNLKLNKAVALSSNLDLERKKRFMAKTSEIILESVYIRGVDKETFAEAHTFICTSVNTLLQEDESGSLLETLNNHHDFLYAHSLGVSLYSVMIAQHMGWSSGNNLYKLSVGGLLHDIGKSELDRDLVNKPKSDLTFAEKALLETHAEKGKRILEKVKSIPTEVADIAFEHHENAIGQGYPRRLERPRINPMAKVIQTADEFCYLAIENPDHQGADASTALNLLEQYKSELVDPEALRALRSLVRSRNKKHA